MQRLGVTLELIPGHLQQGYPSKLQRIRTRSMVTLTEQCPRYVLSPISWPPATTSMDDNRNHVRNVMQPHYPDNISLDPFRIANKDLINTATSSRFWNEMAAEIMRVMGTYQRESLLTVQDGQHSPEL